MCPFPVTSSPFRRILVSCFFLGLCISVTGQRTAVDSLNKLLPTIHSDTHRIDILLEMARASTAIHVDSVDLYLKMARKELNKTKYVAGEMAYLRYGGFVFERKGNIVQALKNFLDDLKMAEELSDEPEIRVICLRLGILYANQGDKEVAMRYFRRAYEIVQKTPSQNHVFELLTLGEGYRTLNELDTALNFSQRAYEEALRFNTRVRIPNILNTLGKIHTSLNHYGLAMEYFRMANQEGWAVFGPPGGWGYQGFCDLFLLEGRYDSVVYYARQRYGIAKAVEDPNGMVVSAFTLARAFDSLGRKDSAYYYYVIGSVQKDSIAASEKIVQMQNLTFNEQLRQKELEENRLKEEAERKANLQMIGIGVFIISMVLIALLLSRIHVSRKLVEFLGWLTVLLLFEFIALFLHPVIGEWTHHNPVFMLIILAGIAAVLIPLHHFTMHWFKQKLVQGQKQRHPASKSVYTEDNSAGEPGMEH